MRSSTYFERNQKGEKDLTPFPPSVMITLCYVSTNKLKRRCEVSRTTVAEVKSHRLLFFDFAAK